MHTQAGGRRSCPGCEPPQRAGSPEPAHASLAPEPPRTHAAATGVETFVFMAGVAQADPTSLPIPGIVGVIIGIICGAPLISPSAIKELLSRAPRELT